MEIEVCQLRFFYRGFYDQALLEECLILVVGNLRFGPFIPFEQRHHDLQDLVPVEIVVLAELLSGTFPLPPGPERAPFIRLVIPAVIVLASFFVHYPVLLLSYAPAFSRGGFACNR